MHGESKIPPRTLTSSTTPPPCVAEFCSHEESCPQTPWTFGSSPALESEEGAFFLFSASLISRRWDRQAYLGSPSQRPGQLVDKLISRCRISSINLGGPSALGFEWTARAIGCLPSGKRRSSCSCLGKSVSFWALVLGRYFKCAFLSTIAHLYSNKKQVTLHSCQDHLNENKFVAGSLVLAGNLATSVCQAESCRMTSHCRRRRRRRRRRIGRQRF